MYLFYAWIDEIIRWKSGTAKDDALESLKRLIAESQSADQLEGIAFGALTGLRNLDAEGSVRPLHILESLEKRSAALDRGTPLGKVVSEVIKSASLPLLRQNHLFQSRSQQPEDK